MYADTVSIFKPNTIHAKVAEDSKNLGKNLTKQDHILIQGEPGNRLGRNYYSSVEKDINLIAERTSNTNVGFVNLFKMQSKQWINRRIGRVNLQLDQPLIGT
jgi:hypothetical protein